MSILENNEKLSSAMADIAEVAGYLWTKGWAERNGGNISVNVTEFITPGAITPLSTVTLPRRFPALGGDAFYVTGTGKRMRDVAKAPLQHGAIIRLHPDAGAYDIIADRIIAPTSELPSHLAIHDFARAGGAKVVCHTHPTDLIALTHRREFLQPRVLGRMLWSMIPEARIVVPRGVGIVPYHLPGSLELADATIAALDSHDVVMWEKHGCLAVGADIIDTFDMIDTLSKAAQIYLSARLAGFEPEGMSNDELEEIRRVFNLLPEGN
ncbi:MAG: rhamnulose-1-phosphate aldolase [Odoribacteraceae bacterium]|jgi:rhamnulose-1-phosphate aldolase|nr:rhamnulose-1-phosphate aldolase [Odoribacteraceae bacterium]